jgi:hypothetical protein
MTAWFEPSYSSPRRRTDSYVRRSTRRAGRAAPAAAATALLALALPAAGAAQGVSGAVVEQQSKAPLSGTIVLLLDPSGAQVGRTLSDEAGRFRVRAPAAGRYQLRTMRIGFRSATSPALQLDAGTTLDYTFEIASIPVVLPTATVSERARCVVRPAEGELVSGLWSEARKALTAAQLTQDERRFGVTLQQYERDLDPRKLTVREARSWEQSGVTENPYTSLPADSLARHGYVQELATGTWYNAPDARVLLSDEFARDHCFRPHDGEGGAPGLRGVAFEPAEKSSRVDVRGVFWLDRATSELRYLEYRYTGLPSYVPAERVGGRVDFQRLPAGAWIVQRWWIRMPTVVLTQGQRGDQGYRLGETAATGRITGIREVGGEVVRTYAVGAPPTPGALASIRGMVVDSTRGEPLGGAEVALAVGDGEPRRLVADAGGAFSFDSVAGGEYTLTARHPRLDSLGFDAIAQTIELRPGMKVTALVSTPSAADILASLCPASTGKAAGVVHGIVRDGVAGSPLPGARVTVRWDGPGTAGARDANLLRVDADENGRYRACGLPVDTDVTVQGATGTRSSEVRALQASAGDVAFAELLVAGSGRAVARGSAVLTGVLRDSAGRALSSGMVRVVASELEEPVGANGRFRLSKLPPGEHVVEAHAVGFAPVRMRVRLREGATLDTAIVLDHAQVLATVRTTGVRDLNGFEERRRRSSGGRFITRDDIERQNIRRTTDVLLTIPGMVMRPIGRDAAGTGSLASGISLGGMNPGGEYVMQFRRTMKNAYVCPIQFYLDGAPYEVTPSQLDNDIAAQTIEAVEVYDGSSKIPPQFAGYKAGCGVVVLWTRDTLDNPRAKAGATVNGEKVSADSLKAILEGKPAGKP